MALDTDGLPEGSLAEPFSRTDATKSANEKLAPPPSAMYEDTQRPPLPPTPKLRRILFVASLASTLGALGCGYLALRSFGLAHLTETSWRASKREDSLGIHRRAAGSGPTSCSARLQRPLHFLHCGLQRRDYAGPANDRLIVTDVHAQIPARCL
ncbi:MAG: hypothetical protein KC492_26525 [Myxococcales bacterium]|nr:hypothetical protein [Myxococcales bacterium]